MRALDSVVAGDDQKAEAVFRNQIVKACEVILAEGSGNVHLCLSGARFAFTLALVPEFGEAYLCPVASDTEPSKPGGARSRPRAMVSPASPGPDPGGAWRAADRSPRMSQNGLDRIKLFEALPPEELEALAKQCRWHQFSANAQILDQDGENRDIYFIVEGVVRLVNYTVTGREITFANVDAGGFFGEIGALDGQARSTGAVAVEDCRLASLSPETFRRLLSERADVALAVMAQLAMTIRTNDDRIMDLCTLPAPQRIYAELLRMSEPDTVAPGTWVIRPMRTHADIASRANTTRETVTRALGYLVNQGIVERMSKSLYVRDRDRLAKLARSGVGDSEEIDD